MIPDFKHTTPDLRNSTLRLTCDTLVELLIERYGKPTSDFALRDRVASLDLAFKGLHNCKDKRVLDLGCGAIGGTAESRDSFLKGTWAPWLPRAVTALGGYAVGVDLGYVREGEEFEFHSLDLRNPGALSIFEDHSFDAINCTNFFSSPHLVFELGMNLSDRTAMMHRIEAECQRLLKQGGIMITFDRDLNNC